MFQVIFNKITIILTALWLSLFPQSQQQQKPLIVEPTPLVVEQLAVGGEIATTEKPAPIAEKITILDKQYTLAEYAVLKTNVISKMTNRKTVLPQLDDFQKWIEIAKKECPKIVLTDVTEVNLVDRINSYIQNGCK